MPNDLIPALSIGPFKATLTGLEVIGKPPFEVWLAYGQALQVVDASFRWIMGDYLNYGESYYGEMYAQAVEATGLKATTLRNYKWVAAHVHPSLRSEYLSWTHHAVVAALEPEEQARWLMIAQEEYLGTRELRELVSPKTIDSTAEIIPSEMGGILRTIRDMVALPYAQSSEEDYDRIAELADKGLLLLGEEA